MRLIRDGEKGGGWGGGGGGEGGMDVGERGRLCTCRYTVTTPPGVLTLLIVCLDTF